MTPDGKKLFNEKLVKIEEPLQGTGPSEEKQDFTASGYD